MKLELGAIMPEALHRIVGWDMRHHFMAEKLIDRFNLAIPRDRELIRQLAVVYVLEGRTKPAGKPKLKGNGTPTISLYPPLPY